MQQFVPSDACYSRQLKAVMEEGFPMTQPRGAMAFEKARRDYLQRTEILIRQRTEEEQKRLDALVTEEDMARIEAEFVADRRRRGLWRPGDNEAGMLP